MDDFKMPDIDYDALVKKMAEKTHDDVDLSKYFNPEQLANIGEYEGKRLKNVALNYEVMTQLGFPVPKPDFMRKRGKKISAVNEQESDEEWTPRKRRSGKAGKKKWVPPRMFRVLEKAAETITKPAETVTRSEDTNEEIAQIEELEGAVGDEGAVGGSGETVNQGAIGGTAPPISALIQDFEGFDIGEEKPIDDKLDRLEKMTDRVLETNSRAWKIMSEHPIDEPSYNELVKELSLKKKKRRRSKRKTTKTNYANIEVPDDDHFLFCEDCNEEHLGDCPVHGPLIIVHDTPVLKGKYHAKRSVPGGLCINTSIIPGAGEGVFAEVAIPKGVRFGPYKGDKKQYELDAIAAGYSWQITSDSKTETYVDAADETRSNWMRYVNCARNEEEQNLLAFQYKGEIFYKTLDIIDAHTELLVWYGDSYGEELGITEQSAQSLHMKQIMEEACEDLCCPYCGVVFTSFHAYVKHFKGSHGRASVQHLFHAPKENILSLVGDILRTASTSLDMSSAITLQDKIKTFQHLRGAYMEIKSQSDHHGSTTAGCYRRGDPVLPSVSVQLSGA